MNSLTAEKTAFGRHETFPLRFGWLTKGFSAWRANPEIFESDDATVELGVGKNMVNAIRYWMTAAQVIDVSRKGITATDLGAKLFGDDGWDPYLEDDATIWLLHWLIASNACDATSIFWFFNRFHKPEFTAAELQVALQEFVTKETRSRATPGTVKHDVALLLRMYEPTASSKDTPIEEALDSPLSALGLLKHADGSRFHESKPEPRPELPVVAFAYGVAESFRFAKVSALPIDALMRSDGVVASPGSVFRLNEEGVISKLEQLVAWVPGRFELRETAGTRQLYIFDAPQPIDILKRHYDRKG